MIGALFWGLVIISCAVPIGWLAIRLMRAAGEAGGIEFGLDGFRLKLLVRTLFYNGSAAVIALALAVPAALMLGRGGRRAATVLALLLPVVLLLPSITYAYGWRQVARLAGWHFMPASAADVARCVWTLAAWLWPIPAAAMGLALRRMDRNVQQQAILDGALGRLTARQLLPSALAGGAIVLVLAGQEFAVYEPTGISVVATEVRMVFDTGAFASGPSAIMAPMGASESLGRADQDARAASAAAVATPLLAASGLLAAAMVFWARRSAAQSESLEIGPPPPILRIGVGPLLAALGVIALTVGLPVGAMIQSLHRPWRTGQIWQVFSPQLTGTLWLGAAAGASGAALAICGIAGSIGKRGLNLAIGLGLAGFVIGGQLIAVALIRMYNRPHLGWIYDGPIIVIMAYLGRFGWIAVAAARATRSGAWTELRDLAAIDGASTARTGWAVVMPLAWPMIAAVAVLLMILSMTEAPATVLLNPQRPQTLIPMLMQWVHMQRYDDMLEGSLLLMGVVACLAIGAMGFVVISWRMWRRARRARRGGRSIAAAVLIASIMGPTAGCDRGRQPVDMWCVPGESPAQVVYPRAIAHLSADDSFVVIDRMARVQRLDARGNPLAEWRMPEWQQGKPVGVSVGPDGNIYVPDTHYHRVMVYTPTGTLLRQWGSMGREPGQFVFPTDIAFDSKGRIFVAEYGDHDRVQIFSPDGVYQSEFGSFGQDDGEFMRPQSLVIDGTDTVYIADACNHRIVVFTAAGRWVRNMGRAGSGDGEFRYPYGLALEGEGRLIVAEFGNNRVQRIDAHSGRGLGTWGRAGHEPGELAYPWAVAIDARGRAVVVDSGNNRVQVVAF